MAAVVLASSPAVPGGFPPLPRAPLPRVGDTHISYGSRVLQFVLDTSCTAVLTDEQLALADHAFPVLIGARDIEPAAVATLSRVRHYILAALHTRRAMDEALRAAVPPVTPPERPNVGPMAVVTRPDPPQTPPSAKAVVCDF